MTCPSTIEWLPLTAGIPTTTENTALSEAALECHLTVVAGAPSTLCFN